MDRFAATGHGPRLLVIDNYDSFTYNLVHGLCVAGADVAVARNDELDRKGVVSQEPAGIVLSPGPGNPAVARDVGVCQALLAEPLDVPVLGVCLGMQAMAHVTGGRVVPAKQIVHGEQARVRLGPHPVFNGLPDEVQVGRYHSLAVDGATLPEPWQALGTSEDHTLMAMAHAERPWVGVQFHPESILTPEGPIILHNFVELCR